MPGAMAAPARGAVTAQLPKNPKKLVQISTPAEMGNKSILPRFRRPPSWLTGVDWTMLPHHPCNEGFIFVVPIAPTLALADRALLSVGDVAYRDVYHPE